jgi:hypothetical protein
LRRRELVADSHLWLAVAAGVAAALFGADAAIGEAMLKDVVPAVLAYAAIGFGFALAGLTISITIPDAGFARLLATAKPPDPKKKGLSRATRRRRRRALKREEPPNAYLDLMFVFSWTALVHWLTLAWGAGMVAACGLDREFFGDSACWPLRAASGVLAALVVYAVLQFLGAVLTLAGLGSVYVSRLRGPKAAPQRSAVAEDSKEQSDRNEGDRHDDREGEDDADDDDDDRDDDERGDSPK